MWRRPKLKNAFVAIFSEKDRLLDVLNDRQDHVLRVLSTSTNMPEMIEKQKYVSSVAAYVIQLELWCASSLDEPLQEITARFAELWQNIDEEVCSNSADIVEIVERNVGYHLNKVIFEHESVSAVEFSDIVPTCVRSSLSTQERSVDADIAGFNSIVVIASNNISIDKLFDCYGSFCVSDSEYFHKIIVINFPATDPVYLHISPDVDKSRERNQVFNHTLERFKICLRVLFAKWKLGQLDSSLVGHNRKKYRKFLLELSSHLIYFFYAKGVFEHNALLAVEEDFLKKLVVMLKHLMVHDYEIMFEREVMLFTNAIGSIVHEACRHFTGVQPVLLSTQYARFAGIKLASMSIASASLYITSISPAIHGGPQPRSTQRASVSLYIASISLAL